VTTFSTYAVVSENRTFHAPEGFEDRFLSLFGCALLTGGGMGIKYGSEVSDGVIGVLGFGGIGMAAALVLKGMSKKNIVIIERSEEKQKMASSLGFNRILNSIAESDSKFDLVIEAAGSIESIQSGFASLTDTGTLVFASHPETGAKISIDPHELIKGKKIFGTWGGDVQPDEDMHIIGKYLKQSGVNLDLLLGEEFTIDDINDGLAYLDSGKPGRPLLTMNED
jgi:Zn-dependent alcohol dehydrogenase